MGARRCALLRSGRCLLSPSGRGSAVALRQSEKLTLCHLYTTPPLLRVCGWCTYPRGDPLTFVPGNTTHHRFPSGLLSIFSHRPWLSGGVAHTGRAHKVGTDQEGSPLHGRWWRRRFATRVGLCVEGLSMIMTRPGPPASSSGHCLNSGPAPGASQTCLRRCMGGGGLGLQTVCKRR